MERNHLSDVEEQKPFLHQEDEENQHVSVSEPHEEANSPLHRYANWYNIVCAVLSVCFLVAGAFQNPTGQQCIRAMNVWSPMLEAFEYEQSSNAYDSRYMYMGHPTVELEDNWEILWKGGSVGIPDDKLPLFNKSVSEKDWHYLPNDQGGGIQAFFEGFHDLHCLNLIRQYTYRHEWNYTNHFFTNQHIPIRDHAAHCLEMLRAKFTCDADTTPYLVVERPGGKVLDMQTLRTCHNVGKIRDWIEVNMVIRDT